MPLTFIDNETELLEHPLARDIPWQIWRKEFFRSADYEPAPQDKESSSNSVSETSELGESFDTSEGSEYSEDSEFSESSEDDEDSNSSSSSDEAKLKPAEVSTQTPLARLVSDFKNRYEFFGVPVHVTISNDVVGTQNILNI